MASQYTCPVSLSSFLASAKPLVGELRPHGEGGPGNAPLFCQPLETVAGRDAGRFSPACR